MMGWTAVRALASAVTIAAVVLGHPPTAAAQGIELMPFAGYRFGGDFFELATASAIDRDGAPAVGFLIDVPFSHDLQFEAFFTHQSADVLVPAAFYGPPIRTRVAVDHVQGGGLRELGGIRVRPFLTGMLGVSRYAVDGDSELRFSIAAGGGVKLFPSSTIGLRLESRLYATLVNADGQVVACGPGRCLLGIHADVAWQAELTAGVVVRIR
jgi:hypothetical protein